MSQVKPRSNLSKKYLFYLLVLSSAFLSASFVVVDTYISTTLIQDPMVVTQVSWISGTLIITVVLIFLALPLRRIRGVNLPIGTYIDPNFKFFHIPPWKVLKFIMLGGVFMSISTYYYFVMLEKYDASTMQPLMSFTIIYLLIGDFILEKDNPTMIEIQGIIAIVAGIFISSLSNSDINLKSVIVSILLLNALSASVTVSHKKATQWVDEQTRKPIDAITFRFYTVISATIINTVIFYLMGTDEQFEIFKERILSSFLIVSISMFLATFSYIAFIRALRMGKMSVVNSLRSFSVVMAIPLTMLGNKYYSHAIPFNAGGITGILLKSIGALLVLTGMVGLALSEVRVMVIAKVQQDGMRDIEKILSLKGVTRVSVLAGKYDLLITIKTRSIGKGYRQTIRQIKGFHNIAEVKTITILKEWN